MIPKVLKDSRESNRIQNDKKDYKNIIKDSKSFQRILNDFEKQKDS